MSLKAGRVGVNPADVDPIDGSINKEITGWTKPVKVPLTGTGLAGLGDLYYMENPSIHMACARWAGNSAAASNQNVVVNYDDMTEKPMIELTGPVRNGDYMSAAYSGGHCTIRVVLKTGTWSGGNVMFPTEPK